MATLRIEPLGVQLQAVEGAPLRDILFPYGVEFPCGGSARCGRCRINLNGIDVLACRSPVDGDAVIEIGGGWHSSILYSDAVPVRPKNAFGLGVAVDLGTTTIVAQLVDGHRGAILATCAELNEQARFGADVMTRIEYALTTSGARDLHQTVRSQVARMIDQVSQGRTLTRGIAVVGNTAMMHFFAGHDVRCLAGAPFSPVSIDEWRDHDLRFLRAIGGFVGSDILAGLLATGMADSPDLNALIDLGTNGEIVVGNREGLACASTAAGPAFEGGRISCGMRAGSGSIYAAESAGASLHCHVTGGGTARGICGSGLVDVVAAYLDMNAIASNGRVMTASRRLPLCDGLELTQSDVRELQLAKGAVAAALGVLLERIGASPADLRHIFLAGAFGNFVRAGSAARIGLLPFSDDRIVPVGNAALAGARLALFNMVDEDAITVEHVPLHADSQFQDRFIEAMRFT